MIIRRFTNQGVIEFSDRLKSLRAGLPADIVSLAVASRYTEVIGETEVEPPSSFSDRQEAGLFLLSAMRDLPSQDFHVETDQALWSWWSAVLFDQICPVNDLGRRIVKDQSRYILDSSSFTRYYRHLLNNPYRIVLAHHNEISNARVVLASPVDSPGDIVEQLVSRQDIVSNPSLLGIASLLYVDEASGKIKRSAASQKGGGARRLADVLAQLDQNWDTEAMAVGELTRLLPLEFSPFIRDASKR